MATTWNKDKALSTLNVEVKPFEPENDNNHFFPGSVTNYDSLQAYSGDRFIAIRPDSKYPMAALMHELAHVVMGHVLPRPMSERDMCLTEIEAASTAAVCLKKLGAPDEELRTQIEHAVYHTRWWYQNESALPSGTMDRIKDAYRIIVNAGK